MQRLDLDPKFDFSSLTNKDEEDYCDEALKLCEKTREKKLSEIFPRSDKRLLMFAKEML